MSDSKTVSVITLEEIKERAKGTIVEIPGWVPGEKIGVRLRAVDLTPHIMQLQSIPNVLRSAALEVFDKAPSKKGEKSKPTAQSADDYSIKDMERMLPIIDAIVKECLIEPEWEKFEQHYPLTIVQKMAIFRFAMAGLDALESFRS